MLEITDQLRQHAEWVEERMPPLLLPAEATRTTEPFVAVGRRGRPLRMGRNGRGSRFVWTAMAAAAVLALLMGGLVVLRSHPRQPAATDPAADESGMVATAPDSVLLPRSMPGGLVATAVRTSAPKGRQSYGLEPTAPPVTQLFGVDQQPALEIRIEPSRPGATQTAGSDQTVRGVPGRFLSAGQPTIIGAADGSYQYNRPDGTDDRYTWFERDAFITASFRNLTPAQTLEIVDAMQWASSDLIDGFTLAADSGLTGLLPPTPDPSSGVGLEAETDYLVEPADTSTITLMTCPAGTGTCPGATYDYAAAWLNGTREHDGSVTVSVDGDPGAIGIGTHGIYLRIWSNGATAQIDFGDGRPVDPALTRSLLGDLAVTDAAGLGRLERQISDGLAAMPLLAAADLPGGRVEVHGVGSLSVTCVAPAGGSSTCGDPWVQPSGSEGPGTLLHSSSIVGGHWFVGASSPKSGTIAFASGTDLDFDHPAGPPLAGETAEATGGATTYQFGLVEVPDGVAGIMLTQSRPGSIEGGSVERPS